ncbi:MAG: hypothetical protein LAT82_06050 [Nanoarchaeota archaeon]|nr:hypothetical protein [Nanoarchaeota archaeon]
MVTSLDDRLYNIEEFLKRIESKMDNFLGFEMLEQEEKEELLQIKKEMKSGNFHEYEDVFT